MEAITKPREQPVPAPICGETGRCDPAEDGELHMRKFVSVCHRHAHVEVPYFAYQVAMQVLSHLETHGEKNLFKCNKSRTEKIY